MSTFIYALPGSRNDDKAPSTARLVHIRRLNDMLHLCIEQNDFERARKAWSILIQCKEFDWKTGGTFIECLEYLRAMMLKCPDEREAILQEIAMRLAEVGRHRDALDELELYLPSFPYQDNAMLHAYAGLLSLQLAVQQVSSGSSEGFNSSDADRNLLRGVLKHFDLSLAIDANNVVVANFQKDVSNRLIGASTNTHQDSVAAQLSDDDNMQVDERIDKRRKRTKK